MKAVIHSNLSCRFCQFYTPEGRRGGECQMLGAHVQGEWAACSLITPSLGSTWESLQESPLLETLQVETLQVEALQVEALQVEALQVETLQVETLQVEPQPSMKI